MTPIDVLKSMLISGLNHGLTILAAWCVTKGLFAAEVATPGNIAVLAGGAAAAIISVVMLLYRKAKVSNLVDAARAVAPNTNEDRFVKIEATADKMPVNLLGK